MASTANGKRGKAGGIFFGGAAAGRAPVVRQPIQKEYGAQRGTQTDLPLTERQALVFGLIGPAETSLTDLRAATGLTASQLSSVLSSLAVRGLVSRRTGRVWRAE